MGGHRRGDLASQICIDSVKDFLTSPSARKTIMIFRNLLELDGRAPWEKNICASIEYANRKIFRASMANPDLHGMGTTVVGIGFNGPEVFVIWCGDSRLYRLRAGTFEQVSDDQSLVNQYLKAGVLTPAEARVFPHKNVILHALGLGEELKYEWLRDRAEPGDIYLLCSDGLNDMVTDERIAEILREHTAGCGLEAGDEAADRDNDQLCDACHELVHAAMDGGGIDNITVMLLCAGVQPAP